MYIVMQVEPCERCDEAGVIENPLWSAYYDAFPRGLRDEQGELGVLRVTAGVRSVCEEPDPALADYNWVRQQNGLPPLKGGE